MRMIGNRSEGVCSFFRELNQGAWQTRRNAWIAV